MAAPWGGVLRTATAKPSSNLNHVGPFEVHASLMNRRGQRSRSNHPRKLTQGEACYLLGLRKRDKASWSHNTSVVHIAAGCKRKGRPSRRAAAAGSRVSPQSRNARWHVKLPAHVITRVHMIAYCFGLTDYPERCRQMHGYPEQWHTTKFTTKDAAKRWLVYFVNDPGCRLAPDPGSWHYGFWYSFQTYPCLSL